MKFEEQHQNYKTYSHEDYNMNTFPFFFISDLKGFIHSQFMKEDPDESNGIALELQHKLAAIASLDPASNGPYEYIFDEIISTLRKLEKKGFTNLMDGLALILAFLRCDVEFNNFFKETSIGYTATLSSGEIFGN